MRDILIPHVRLAVSLQRVHGSLINEHLCWLGFVDLEIRTLYRTLRHLEQTGLLISAWAVGLTAYRGLIDRFFGLYGPLTPKFS